MENKNIDNLINNISQKLNIEEKKVSEILLAWFNLRWTDNEKNWETSQFLIEKIYRTK